jgi:hypothetical protein
VGSHQTSAERLDETDDIFFLPSRSSPNSSTASCREATELINYRRQARATYKQTVLPVSFTGMPEYTFLDDETGSSAGDPGEITGATSGGGQANTMRIIERAPAGAGTG